MFNRFKWVLLIAVLTALAGFSSGCGKADAEAKKIIQQAKVTRGVTDFDLLIGEMAKNPKLSKPVRKACKDLAVSIMREQIEHCKKEQDMEKLQELQEKLRTDPVPQQIPTESLQEQIREVQQQAWLKNLQALKAILLKCSFGQNAQPTGDDFIILQKMHKRTGIEELQNYLPDLIAIGLVLTGYNEPDTLPNMKQLLQKKIVSPCSYCGSRGREKCFTCQGTGKCPQCQGTGSRQESQIQRHTTLSFRKDKREWSSENSASVSEISVECPRVCSRCKGSGYKLGPCRSCAGKKYNVSKRRLAQYYRAQYRVAYRILQEQLSAIQDADEKSETDEK